MSQRHLKNRMKRISFEDSPAHRRSALTPLESLPDELLLLVFGLLEIYEIVRLERVSRRLQGVIRGSILLQYTIECYLGNVVSERVGDTGLEPRVDAIKKWRKAWTDPMWQGRLRLTSPLTSQWYTFVAIDGSTFAQATPEGFFFFLRLCSARRGQFQEKRWTIQVPITDWSRCYTFDYAQDLLALVYCQRGSQELVISLLSCTTGLPHSAVSSSTIRLATGQPLFEETNERTLRLRIQIYNDFLGVYVGNEEEEVCGELWLLGWKTGQIFMNLYNEDDPENPLSLRSFAFLDGARLLVLLRLGDYMPELMVMSISATKMFSTRTNIARFSRGRGTLSLYLPEFPTNTLNRYVTLECYPTKTYLAEDELFAQRNADTIVLLKYYNDPEMSDEGELDGPELIFDLLIPGRVITSLQDRHLSSSMDRDIDLEWPDWFQGGHKIYDITVTRTSECLRVCGSRYVTQSRANIGDDGAANLPKEVCIYDFNQYHGPRQGINSGGSIEDVGTTAQPDPSRFEEEPGEPFREIQTGVVLSGEDELYAVGDGFQSCDLTTLGGQILATDVLGECSRSAGPLVSLLKAH